MVKTISYAPFEELIAGLRADGLLKDADLLHHMIHTISWTTGSELIGELGATISKIKKARRPELSDQTINDIENSMDMVKRVWPDFPD